MADKAMIPLRRRVIEEMGHRPRLRDLEEDQDRQHDGFRLGPTMMGSTTSETTGAILAATRC